MSEQEEPYNAANPKQVKKRVDKAKLAAEQRDEEFRELLALPAFRRFIWNLICARCHILQSAFNPNGSVQTLNIGRQAVGQELLADVERVNPSLIPQMMTEHAESKRE